MQSMLREGAAERKKLDGLQDEILAVRAALKELERAPRPVDEVRAALADDVRAAVTSLNPAYYFADYCRRGRRGSLYHTGMSPANIGIQQVLALQAYTEGVDKVVDRLLARLRADGLVNDMPAAEHEARLSKLRDRLDELERLEELEILRLEEAGWMIVRREEARADLLLAVWAARPAGGDR